MKINDIDCTIEIIENQSHRLRIKNSDGGQEMQHPIGDLMALHNAHQDGMIVQGRI